jgi:hypothetical protein
VVWQHAVLNSKSTQETLQHGSDIVQENVEDPQLVHCQDRVLHVNVVGNCVKHESHQDLQAHALGNRQKNLHNQHRSVVVLGSGNVGATNFLSDEGSSRGSQGESNDLAEEASSEKHDGGVLFSGTEPSGDESKELPLPRVDPEHDELRNSVEQVLANVAAGSERGAEACWLHSDIGVRDDSQNKVGQEVGGESCHCKTLGAHLVDFHDLVAGDGMNQSDGEQVSKAWCPEFVETVEESSVSIADTPEPEGRKEMYKVLLSQVGILLVLFQQLSEKETTIESESDESSEHH